jgi:hypothetical protein
VSTRWKVYLSQRFGKSVSDISPSDWDRANGWKIPSLVWVSSDAGLRPIEVERAVISWADTESAILRIPKEDESKNYNNWTVSLRNRTARILPRWLDQRDTYARYDDTDKLWLTTHGNPYQSQALRYVLTQLSEIAEIDTADRSLSWRTLRHARDVPNLRRGSRSRSGATSAQKPRNDNEIRPGPSRRSARRA